MAIAEVLVRSFSQSKGNGREPMWTPTTPQQQVLTYLRLWMGMSEQELAERLEVRPSRLSDMERVQGNKMASSSLRRLGQLARDYHRTHTAEYFDGQAVVAMERTLKRGGRR